MKYQLSIVIDLPRDQVMALFDDPDNLKKWMHGLELFETIEGEAGEVGAKSRLRIRSGKRVVEIVETITVRNLPQEFSGTYEATGMWNHVQNLFEEISTDQTQWTTNTEFKGQGMMKVIMWLMPGAFRKQSLKHMNDFKQFAEAQK